MLRAQKGLERSKKLNYSQLYIIWEKSNLKRHPWIRTHNWGFCFFIRNFVYFEFYFIFLKDELIEDKFNNFVLIHLCLFFIFM